MAFAESDRVQIRHFLGFSAIFLQADPRLENAILSVQAVTDPGGTRPDNSTELQIKALIVDLQSIETKLKALWDQAQVSAAGKVALDVFRGRMMLCSEGRRLVNGLCRALGTHPRADIFSSASLTPAGDAFADITGSSAGKRW